MFRIVTCSLILNALLFCTPAFAQSDRVYRLALAGAVTAHGADLSSTAWCRGAGTCTEANPALRWAQDDPLTLGVVKMGAASASLLATHALWRRGHKKLALALTVAQIAGFSYVAVRNARTIR